MYLRLAPLRLQDGVWRVNWIPLVGWALTLNTVFFLLVYSYSQPVPSKRLNHPVAVTGKNVILYSVPGTDPAASIVGTVTQGDTLELEAVEATGWCRVTVPALLPGSQSITGYLQPRSLAIPGSTQEFRN